MRNEPELGGGGEGSKREKYGGCSCKWPWKDAGKGKGEGLVCVERAVGTLMPWNAAKQRY